MHKRILQKTRRGISILLLCSMIFSVDATAQAASDFGRGSEKQIQTNTDTFPEKKVIRKKEGVTVPASTAGVTMTASAPAVTMPVSSPAVTQTPGVLPTESPDLPMETGKPVAIPGKISRIYLCSLGRQKVKLTWEESEHATGYEIYRRKKGSSTFRLLAVTKECTYTDKTISYHTTYRYRIVPVAQEGEECRKGKAAGITFRNDKVVAVSHQKYSYSEMSGDIRQLVKNYHGLVQYQIIGKSEDGRNIYDVILGNPDAKKTMLVVSALHAREYMTSLLCMNQIEYYLQNYQGKIDGKKGKNILQKIAIHYIPMANPDGVTISQYGIQKINSPVLRRKLHRMSRGSTRRWKANARGVDLNRNFPYLFLKAGRRGSAGYTGPYAASESETIALVKLVNELQLNTRLQGVVNYHAMGSIVFGDCQKSGSFVNATRKMYRVARKTTGYRSAAGYRGSTSQGRGCLREYVMYGIGIPSITLEIGKYACPGSIREFPSIWRKNRKLVFREADIFV